MAIPAEHSPFNGYLLHTLFSQCHSSEHSPLSTAIPAENSRPRRVVTLNGHIPVGLTLLNGHSCRHILVRSHPQRPFLNSSHPSKWACRAFTLQRPFRREFTVTAILQSSHPLNGHSCTAVGPRPFCRASTCLTHSCTQ
ncbi:hypothetical protein AVEN_267549-1 [Araneus ventricosus]|uniref:Uncharacterized protein n=1 Tax=Araneus ventricosus TaxID=182803 RepID=A0A4Y2STW4_ARAVE|nr:hypothetical protein AVEN_267549-1 [Araneus ventricosus]